MRTRLSPIVRFPLASFVVLAYAAQVALVYIQYHHIPSGGLGFFRVYMPAIVALVVALIAFGRKAAVKLISSLGVWRVHPKFYLFAALYPPAVAFASLAIIYALGLKDTIELETHTLATFSFFKLSITVSMVEEIAWVGFALMMTKRYFNLLPAAMFAGALWGIWYIPLVLADIQVAPGLPIAPLILNFMTIGAICGWLYARTQSALLVFIMQVTTNYTSQFVPVLPLRGGVTQYVIFVALKSSFAVALYLIWERKPLFARAPAACAVE